MKMNTNFHLSLLVLVFYCALVTGYINVRLEDKLCTSTANKSLTLLEDSDSAAIFTQQWNGTATSPAVDCQFIVYSSWDAYRIPKGTYITITHLNFRKNPKTNECLDFIQFVDGKSAASKRICDATVVDGPTKSPLIIDQRQRDILVIIHIDNSTKINEPLELRMVMTAHSQCNHKGDFLCDTKVPYSCISRHFVNDSIRNCMRPCRDEKSCWPETVDTKDVNAAKTESPKVGQSIGVRFSDPEPNYVTVEILEQKLKESVERLSAIMKENQASLLRQIDVKIINNRKDHSFNRADNDDGVANENDVAMEACVTNKFLEDKLKENSQLIINTFNSSKNRIARIESLLFDVQQDIFRLVDQMEQVLKKVNQSAVNN